MVARGQRIRWARRRVRLAVLAGAHLCRGDASIVGVVEQVVADMADARRRRAAIDPLSGSLVGEDVPMSVLLAADTGHDVDFEPERLGSTARTPDL